MKFCSFKRNFLGGGISYEVKYQEYPMNSIILIVGSKRTVWDISCLSAPPFPSAVLQPPSFRTTAICKGWPSGHLLSHLWSFSLMAFSGEYRCVVDTGHWSLQRVLFARQLNSKNSRVPGSLSKRTFWTSKKHGGVSWGQTQRQSASPPPPSSSQWPWGKVSRKQIPPRTTQEMERSEPQTQTIPQRECGLLSLEPYRRQCSFANV